MAVRFICDVCGFEVPGEGVHYETYEGWFATGMRVLKSGRLEDGVRKEYRRRILCETTERRKGKVTYTGCFHDTIKKENLVCNSSGHGSFYQKRKLPG